MKTAPPEQMSEMTIKPKPTVKLRPRNDLKADTAFGCPRDFLDNRFIYAVVSPRARGLSLGVNMNPDKHCNFDCVYCEVNRSVPATESELDLDQVATELRQTLASVHSGMLRGRLRYQRVPDELLKLRHVALSGDGEPTLCPNFAEAVQTVVHVRALGEFPFFKLVLITNATGLRLPSVQEGLRFFTEQDEIWAKLDAGTQDYMDKINRPESESSIDEVIENILAVGQERPVVIQSLFASISGQEPTLEEVTAYAQRLLALRNGGAKISLVQIYSATRPIQNDDCSHLPLKSLSRIAQAVRQQTDLRVEVF